MRRGGRGIRMIYQITLYEGKWGKKVSERSVRSLVRQWFPCSRNEARQGLKTHDIWFQPVEEGVLVFADFTVHQNSAFFDIDEELIIDKLYHCFYSLKPEYESMVEVILLEE